MGECAVPPPSTGIRPARLTLATALGWALLDVAPALAQPHPDAELPLPEATEARPANSIAYGLILEPDGPRYPLIALGYAWPILRFARPSAPAAQISELLPPAWFRPRGGAARRRSADLPTALWLGYNCVSQHPARRTDRTQGTVAFAPMARRSRRHGCRRTFCSLQREHTIPSEGAVARGAAVPRKRLLGWLTQPPGRP